MKKEVKHRTLGAIRPKLKSNYDLEKILQLLMKHAITEYGNVGIAEKQFGTLSPVFMPQYLCFSDFLQESPCKTVPETYKPNYYVFLVRCIT